MTKRRLIREDFAEPSPVVAARYFLGKYLCVAAADGYSEGRIIEAEAYGGAQDKASHAHGNRRTPRTEVMFAQGGVAYVYLCYGMHRLFNIVTGPEGTAKAVLIRAVEITAGQDLVRRRRSGVAEKHWANGPGRVCAALGIDMAHNRTDLTGTTIWLEDRGEVIRPRRVGRGPRIGVNYAGVWAAKPWRFVLRGTNYSAPRVP